MATTNKDIIAAYKVAHNIPLTTPLYTYAVWRNMGYQVKKGEKCKHRVQMWKMSTKENEEGNTTNTGRCFHKTMSLFEMSQVQRMV